MNEALIHRHQAFVMALLERAEIPSMPLREAMLYCLNTGGKRIRPLLVYHAAEILSVDIEIADVLAASMELMHTYSLVHDDLPAMDNDDFRRGLPTCHRAFDEATAILVGDALQSLALSSLSLGLASHLSAERILNVMNVLLKASGPAGMISGQSMDMTQLSAPVSKEELLTIHRLKTGCMFSACVEMVIAASDADEANQAALREFAGHLGVVFQMQDDYLDRTCPNQLGKGRSSDVSNQKFTFADCYALEALKAEIDQYYDQCERALSPFREAEHLRALLMGLRARG